MSKPGAQRIVPPIVAGEPGDLCFFRSAEDAGRYFEPWFARNEEYLAYDSEGRQLHLAVEPEVRPRRFLWFRWMSERERVVVRTQHDEAARPDELAALLREWLPRIGVPLTSPQATPLPELLKRAIERSGFTG